MTEHGAKLSEYSTEDIIELFQSENDGKAVKRLIVAREYLKGQSPAQISEKFGWPEQTIYTWLDRLESRGLEDGLHDEPPPGRPSRLSDQEFEQFRSALLQSPDNVGFDASAWSSSLAQQFLRREFDHDFSRRHVRRLLKRAGLSWQTSRPQPPTADPEERKEFRDDLKKTD